MHEFWRVTSKKAYRCVKTINASATSFVRLYMFIFLTCLAAASQRSDNAQKTHPSGVTSVVSPAAPLSLWEAGRLWAKFSLALAHPENKWCLQILLSFSRMDSRCLYVCVYEELFVSKWRPFSLLSRHMMHCSSQFGVLEPSFIYSAVRCYTFLWQRVS